MDDLTAEKEQRKQYQQGRERGHQGSRNCLVDRHVDHFQRRLLANLAEIFAHPVKYHDGIVQRVTDDRQNCRQHTEIEVELQHRKQAQRDHHIVNQRGNGAEREAVFEAKPDVDEDCDQRVEHGQPAVLGQLLADLRADEIDSPHVDICFSRRSFQQSDDLGADLGLVLLFVRDQPDQNLVGAAEVLHDSVAETAGLESAANRLQLDRLRITDLDDAAAGKIDTDIQLQRRQADHRAEQQNHGQDHRRKAQRHEIHMFGDESGHDQIASLVICLRP